MRVLWITNIPLPPICLEQKMPVPAVGGWMYSSLKSVRNRSDFRFAVATVYNGNILVQKEIDGIVWYLLPLRGDMIKYNSNIEKYWLQIRNSFNPDVIHIHGSEYPHGLAYVNACGTNGVVVSIQGLVSSCARYFTAGINDGDLKRSLTPRDIIRQDSILQGQQKFEKRGILERKLLEKVGHIIGRTDWDRNHAWAINPMADYHFCGETLRESFYNSKWDYNKCDPFTIFVSQASYPIKGLHILLEALPFVLRRFPQTKVKVAGFDPTSRPWWHISGYGQYLKTLIQKLDLRKHVEFMGTLCEEKMCEQYLQSNLFVCCSAIENSPNSLGEAQMLGMPYIASYVGGIPEIVGHNPSVLYRFEEKEMLAEKIIDIFSQGAAYIPADNDLSRYDEALNSSRLCEIYQRVGSVTQQD